MKEYFIQTKFDEWIWTKESEAEVLKDLIIYFENKPEDELIQIFDTNLKTDHWSPE